MKDTTQKLRDNLIQVRNILKNGTLLTLSREEKDAMLTDSQNLLEKLDSFAQSSLIVGLLGGTGVGKSTLMNALAGSAISSTSHRRPHTDSVLIYRHAESPFPPSLTMSDVPWHEFTHEANQYQSDTLCDLPDFDSLMGEHREHVLHFLEYLDVLVGLHRRKSTEMADSMSFCALSPRRDRISFSSLIKQICYSKENPSMQAIGNSRRLPIGCRKI